MHAMIVKIATLISAIIAFNVALAIFGYGIVLLPLWVLYLTLFASVIVIASFVMDVIMPPRP